MAWEHLSVTKPHLVYIILGGFTSLFMLVSSIIKERLYIGEATVATLCGIIFGPHAANLINPRTWGNEDLITLEFSRIVLVTQCFAVGVELPKAYMERHWKSVTLLLVPVMTFGWLITSLFIWAMFTPHMNWLDSLCCAACVTATDPVLASSVVGKGKFAKRVPKHLRDLLSAESGCNDGMAFPFIYLAIYIIRYHHHPDKVSLHWFCYTILYECIFGAVYGVLIGYAARRAIRYAHEKDWIDRESFLVFYFVLALFCAGSGSILGVDDLLVGFACGVGFSNDGWFTEKTEESHVSNVIDLLINLTFFVYFGAIIPWDQYNAGYLGLDVWRLVVIAILVLLFRRIPIMVAMKPIIPDIKTWRESLFAGHFGPIGVGAIFVAILARAELETEETTPLAVLPPEGFPHRNIIELIWPITTFLVICSIIVHGSSIAVFTLGKHINTLTFTMSYTQANDQNWMDRLPRIQSRSKGSMSIQLSDSELDEKAAFGPGMLPPVGAPGTFLRRQKEEDNPSRNPSRANSRTHHKSRKSKNRDSGLGPGGPISASAIAPARRQEGKEEQTSRSDSETLAAKSESPPDRQESDGPTEKAFDESLSPGEIYEEGEHTVYEDDEGNVLAVEPATHMKDQHRREEDEYREGRRLMRDEEADNTDDIAPDEDDPRSGAGETKRHMPEENAPKSGVTPGEEHHARPGQRWREGMHKFSEVGGALSGLRRKSEAQPSQKPPPEKLRGPARAYQFGNTIIVEDEDGEVIKKYDIPAGPDRKGSVIGVPGLSKHRLANMGKMLGLGGSAADDDGDDGPSDQKLGGVDSDKKSGQAEDDDDDRNLRMTIGGRRMSKADFIDHIRQMDPKSRARAVEDSNAPEPVKLEARRDLREQAAAARGSTDIPVVPEHPDESGSEPPRMERAHTADSNSLKLVDSERQEIPFHDLSQSVRAAHHQGETAAERRRRLALEQVPGEADSDSEDDGTERVPPQRAVRPNDRHVGQARVRHSSGDAGETAAERRRREGALGIRQDEESGSSDSDSASEADAHSQQNESYFPHRPQPVAQRIGIRFADQPRPQQQQEQPQPQPAQQPVSQTASGPRRRGLMRWGKSAGR